MAAALQELLVVMSDPACPSAEKIRGLRTNVARLIPKEGPLIAVCSTWPQEGKSCISANLAAAFAQVRSGAILVDADLRRPTLTALADLSDRPGLVAYLRSPGSSPNTYLAESGIPGLSLLPAGRADDKSPVDLLEGKALDQVMNSLAATGKPVVLDTPPVSVGSDALLVGARCDGVILVVHSKHWEGTGELEAKVALEDHGARILGVVLNEVKEGGSGNYQYYHRSRS